MALVAKIDVSTVANSNLPDTSQTVDSPALMDDSVIFWMGCD